MVDNTCVQCNYCKIRIRLRFQMGYFDIPFDICCPECGVHISGVRRIIDESSIELHNANLIVCPLDDVDYYADFSVELPHSKIKKFVSQDEIIKNGFSPFMMTMQLFKDDIYFQLTQKMGNTLSFRDDMWPRISALYDLLFSRKIELMKEPLHSISERFVVKNELDAMMALHQTCVMGFNKMLPDGTLQEFIDLSKIIYRDDVVHQLGSLIDILGKKEYFEFTSKRLIKIYTRWLSDFEKYMSATILELGNAKDSFDREKYGIATTSFENVMSFYADSYELILDMIDIAVLLNNVTVRGDYNKFSPRANVKDFSGYFKQAKSERVKSMLENEPFGKVIPLNRNIRNAIAHYTYDFDSSSQRITFVDKYKNKESKVETYLIDLAMLCYENMRILIYLDELMYSLQKWDYIRAGMKPNIKAQ